ncbi:hypothetical protein [Sporomusa paucivorans]|uniref:hypothetical protein n=1 Tax=Sporomusa paucivorans TaxID=2376 RepID=UPI003570CA74
MVELAIDINAQNREALKWILNYHELRKAYISLTEEFSEIAATAYTGMPHGSGVGNPTMHKSIKLMDLEYHKKWLIVIEMMERTLSEKRQVYLEFRRRAECLDNNAVGRPGWVGYVQARYADWHERRYGQGYPPSKQTMSKWMNDIVDVTVRLAIRQGIL